MRFYTSAQLYRNQILIRGYEDGKRVQYRAPANPYLFVPTKNPEKKTQYRTLFGRPVEKLPFDTVHEAREFVKQYEEVVGFEFYGLTNFLYTYLNDMYPGEIKYDPELIRVMNIDIEVASDDGFPDIKLADKPITAITCKTGREVVVFGCGEFDTSKYVGQPFTVTYHNCINELDLLGKFLLFWDHPQYSPDVVTGWNVEFFDIPYIVNRIVVLMGEEDAKRLSPWRMLTEKTIEIRGKENQAFVPAGITILDYLHLYKKFSFTNHESYKLDFIGEVELGEKKLDYSEYGSLLELYRNNFQKFIEYNIQDVLIVDRLDDKLGLIEQVFALAYDAKVTYNDTLTTVRPWDVIIHNYLLNKGIVIPQFTVSNELIDIPGGYVKEPQLGMHKWVVSFDLNSLYPHLIMHYNISPETLRGSVPLNGVDWLLEGNFDNTEAKQQNYTVCANGATYKKDFQGFLPEIMQKMYDDRVVYKNKMIQAKKRYEISKSKDDEKEIARYHNLQMAKKIQLNSAYGALGNRWFRWFSIRNASAITLSGQLSIRWIEKKMNEYLNSILKTDEVDYVLASDTDSIYVTLDALIQKVMPNETDKTKVVNFIDRICKDKIEPFIDQSYDELASYMNAYQQKMKMKRESIADRGVWVAKKMYILNVYDSEGVRFAEPQLKMMGIAAVRSSTPMSIRKRMKETFKLVMTTDEPTVQKYIADFKEEFIRMPFEEVAFPRGVSEVDKYKDTSSIYKKGTPIAVRGALLYNNLIVKMKLQKKLEPINDGDKVKFAYLKIPNHIKENVISVPGSMPKEFGLDDYVDYETQFHKGYVEPVKSVLDVIGWTPEKRMTLDQFFG